MASPFTARKWKIVLWGALAVTILFYLALPVVSSRPAVRRWVERLASSVSGHPTTIGFFRVHHDLSMTVQSVTVAGPGEPPFLEVDRVRLGWLSPSLLRGRMGWIDVEKPRLFVNRLPRSARKPVSEAGKRVSEKEKEGKASSTSLPIDQVRIRNAWVEYPVEDRTVELGPFDLSVDSIRAGAKLGLHGTSDIADGAGAVDWTAELSPDFDAVDGHASVKIDDLRRISATFAEIDLPELAAETSASLTLSFAGSLADRLAMSVDAELRHSALPEPVLVSGDGSFLPLSRAGTLQLAVKPQAQLPAIDLQGSLGQNDAGEPTIDARLAWDGVAVDALLQPFSLPWQAAGDLRLSAQAQGEVASLSVRGVLDIGGAALRAPSWNATGSAVTMPFRLEDGALHAEEDGFLLTQWKGSIASFDWQVERLTMQGKVGTSDADVTAEVSSFAASGLQFHDADYLRAGEGLIVRGPLHAQLGESGSVRLKLDVVASDGEVLWDRFYMKLASHPPRARGTIDVSPQQVVAEDLQLSISGIGKARIDGRYDVEKERTTGKAAVEIPGLAALYDVAVRDAFGEAYPLLARTALRGAASAEVEYHEDAGTSLSGSIRLDDVGITASEPSLEVNGLSLALPFELGENLPTVEPRTGLLRVTEARFGTVQTRDVAIPFAVGANQLTLASAVRIPLLGGALFLPDFDADRLAGPEPRARFSLHLQDIDLTELSAALGGPPLRGTVTGAIPNVTVEAEEIRSEGEIRARLFGGEAVVQNLRFSQLFSPVPALQLDLAVEGISLGEMTDTFEIGHVSGIVRGRVSDLEIVRGQPVRFEAWMETVPHPDVPQRVSVKAIRQLSILGGSGGDPLSHGILSFFDEYRYAKMGFRCSLKNDRFTLHGIEEIDGKDYLVVGAVMPPRVNVISHNQTISFSQMISRLERALAKTEDEVPATEE